MQTTPSPSGRRRDPEAEAATARYLAFADAVIRALVDGASAGADGVAEGRILRELGRSPDDLTARAQLERMRCDELIGCTGVDRTGDALWRLRAKGRRLAGILSAALDEHLYARS